MGELLFSAITNVIQMVTNLGGAVANIVMWFSVLAAAALAVRVVRSIRQQLSAIL